MCFSRVSQSRLNSQSEHSGPPVRTPPPRRHMLIISNANTDTEGVEMLLHLCASNLSTVVGSTSVPHHGPPPLISGFPVSPVIYSVLPFLCFNPCVCILTSDLLFSPTTMAFFYDTYLCSLCVICCLYPCIIIGTIVLLAGNTGLNIGLAFSLVFFSS